MTDKTASLRERVAHWVRPEIRALSAYHVPDAEGLVKLDAMENPYGWPEELVEEWRLRLRRVSLNRYPDPAARHLLPVLREAMGVPAGAALLLGNGSDELIQILMLAMAGEGRCVLTVEPGFVMYRMIATFTGLDYVGVPLRDDFALDTEATLAAIDRHQPALVFLACPNNPTGNVFDREAVAAIIERAPGLVILDEAYHAFTDHTWMPDLPHHDNLLVMRTVSKMGLAGLRLGLLAGAPDWIAELDKIRLPYNINVLTQETARLALERREILAGQTRRIREDRHILFNGLRQFPELTVYPSEANFILFRVPAGRADAIFDGLKAQGILIKNLSHAGEALRDCLRVTVGTEEENERFLTALQKIL